jgi:hypothetical protein
MTMIPKPSPRPFTVFHNNSPPTNTNPNQSAKSVYERTILSSSVPLSSVSSILRLPLPLPMDNYYMPNNAYDTGNYFVPMTKSATNTHNGDTKAAINSSINSATNSSMISSIIETAPSSDKKQSLSSLNTPTLNQSTANSSSKENDRIIIDLLSSDFDDDEQDNKKATINNTSSMTSSINTSSIPTHPLKLSKCSHCKQFFTKTVVDHLSQECTQNKAKDLTLSDNTKDTKRSHKKRSLEGQTCEEDPLYQCILCPHYKNKDFVNVIRHMRVKHPKFDHQSNLQELSRIVVGSRLSLPLLPLLPGSSLPSNDDLVKLQPQKVSNKKIKGNNGNAFTTTKTTTTSTSTTAAINTDAELLDVAHILCSFHSKT